MDLEPFLYVFMSFLSALLLILAWGHACIGFEGSAEVALTGESGLFRYSHDGKVCCFYQGFCLFPLLGPDV